MSLPIPEDEFARLWHDGLSLNSLAARLGVSRPTVKRYARLLDLPNRTEAHYEPTHEEIERAKAELRAKHLEEMRSESDFASRARDWRERRRMA